MPEEKNKMDIFQHGSTWVRADFHLHTKADSKFSYSGEENDFITSYVNGLAKAGVSVGVITNHNKFDRDEFVALQKKAVRENIFLLPGIELSVNDGANGIHTLIVFSDEWIAEGQDFVNPLLQTLFIGRTPEEYEHENGRTVITGLFTVLDEIKKFEKDFLLIFAHVEDRSGLWNELEGGRITDCGKNETFRQMTAGFQKVRTHDLSDRKCRTKVKHWLADWYPAEVEGSDCKSLDEIGKGEKSFLKIGSFSFEAVRFALYDHQNRVAKKLPIHRRSFIKDVRFDGGTLNGKQLSFSSELNTLIGIRGSGKSSIIEAIRYCLDIPFGEKAQDIEYKEKLIRHTLGSGGKVTIHAVDEFGQEFEIRRIWEHTPEVFIQGKLQPGVSIRETILSKPLYFGQKDLSSSGEGFEKSLVEKLVETKLGDIRRRIEEQKQRVSTAIKRYRKLNDLSIKREEYTKKQQDAEFQLARYKKYDIESRLQKQIDFDIDSRKLSDIEESTINFKNSIVELLAQHEDKIINQRQFTSNQNQQVFDDYFKAYDDVIALLVSLKSFPEKIEITLKALSEKRNAFESIRKNLKEEFATVERNIADELKAAGIPTLRSDEYRQLSKTIDQAKAIVKELDKEQARAKDILEELQTEMSALNQLWLEEYTAIKKEMDSINANNSSLTIHVGFKEDRESFKNFLRDMMRGRKIHDITFEKVKDDFPDCIEIFNRKSELSEKLGTSFELFWSKFDEQLESLLLYQVPNKFTIQYKGKELKDHSLGQRASALILFVLSQRRNTVILIDQPEDDLDNQTIYEDVIKLIHELKVDTQFIFATHNPNIPVLGDAEMIVACEYANDQITVIPGSIDQQNIQERIVNIMEGGADAFNRRKEIYRIWKPLNSSK